MKRFLDYCTVSLFGASLIYCLVCLVSCAAFERAVNEPSPSGTGTVGEDFLGGLVRVVTNPSDVLGWKSITASATIIVLGLLGWRWKRAK